MIQRKTTEGRSERDIEIEKGSKRQKDKQTKRTNLTR